MIGSLDGLPTTGGVDSRRVSSLIDFESLERPVSIEFPSFNLNLRVGEYVQESYPRLYFILGKIFKFSIEEEKTKKYWKRNSIKIFLQTIISVEKIPILQTIEKQ